MPMLLKDCFMPSIHRQVFQIRHLLGKDSNTYFVFGNLYFYHVFTSFALILHESSPNMVED